MVDMIQSDQSLRVADLEIADWQILAYDPNGLEWRTTVDYSAVELPPEIEEIIASLRVEDASKRRLGQRTPTNEPRFFLTGWQDIPVEQASRKAVQLHFRPTDYYAFRATLLSLHRLVPATGRTICETFYSPADPVRIRSPFLFPSFGINLAVITADDFLLVPKRSESVAVSPGKFNSSMNEGLHGDDARGNAVDLTATAVRGLWEELRIDLPRDQVRDNLSLTCLGFSRRFCQFGAIGHVRVVDSAETIIGRVSLARDASLEIAVKIPSAADSKRAGRSPKFDIEPIPFRPDAVADLLRLIASRSMKITSWGLVTFLLPLIQQFPDEVRKVFCGPFWESADFLDGR